MDSTLEEWREVPGSDGWYEASSLGRIRSYYSANRRAGYPIRRSEPRMLKPSVLNNGYLVHSMKLGGALKSHLLHRIVAATFLGPCPEGMEVCHNDGNQLNNSAANLRYDTREANLAERIMPVGEDHHGAKLTDEKVAEIRRLRTDGWKFRELAERFGVSGSTLSRICAGTRWQHVQAA